MNGGQGGWGWLDDEERQWIRDFQKVREANAAKKGASAEITTVPKRKKVRPL